MGIGATVVTLARSDNLNKFTLQEKVRSKQTMRQDRYSNSNSDSNNY